MIISRFMCRKYLFSELFGFGVHCDVQCDDCKPKVKDMPLNEEKDTIYFVWEKTTRGGMVLHYQAAIYRGMPKTGMGATYDNEKFLRKEKITEEEAKEPMITLISRYPCPPKPETV